MEEKSRLSVTGTAFWLTLLTITHALPTQQQLSYWNAGYRRCLNTSYSVTSGNAWHNPFSTGLLANATLDTIDIFQTIKNQADCGMANFAAHTYHPFGVTADGALTRTIIPRGVDGTTATPFPGAAWEATYGQTGVWRALSQLTTLTMATELDTPRGKVRQYAEILYEACVDSLCGYSVPIICSNMAPIITEAGQDAQGYPLSNLTCYEVYEAWQLGPTEGSNCTYTNGYDGDSTLQPNNYWVASAYQPTRTQPGMLVTSHLVTMQASITRSMMSRPVVTTSIGYTYNITNLGIGSPILNDTATLLDIGSDNKISVFYSGDTNRANGYVPTFPIGCIGSLCMTTTAGKLANIWKDWGTIDRPLNDSGNARIHYNPGENTLYLEAFTTRECTAERMSTWSLLVYNTTIAGSPSKSVTTKQVMRIAVLLLRDLQVVATDECGVKYSSAIMQNGMQLYASNVSIYTGSTDLHRVKPVDDDYYGTKNAETRILFDTKNTVCRIENNYTITNPMPTLMRATGEVVYVKSRLIQLSSRDQQRALTATTIGLLNGLIPTGQNAANLNLLNAATRKFRGTSYSENLLASISAGTIMAAVYIYDLRRLSQLRVAPYQTIYNTLFTIAVATVVTGAGAAIGTATAITILANNLAAHYDTSNVSTEVTNYGKFDVADGGSAYGYYIEQLQLKYVPPNYTFSIYWSSITIGLTCLVAIGKLSYNLRNPPYAPKYNPMDTRAQSDAQTIMLTTSAAGIQVGAN